VIEQAKTRTGLTYQSRFCHELLKQPAIRARLVTEIESELAALPAIEEMSWGDVATIAEAVWARACAPLEAARVAAQAEADRQAQEEAARRKAESDRSWAVLAKRNQLIRDGDALAKPALEGMRAFRRLEWWQQPAHVATLQTKIREHLGRLSDADVLAMTSDGLHELVEDLLPATFQ
jgi:hypothetical protein